MELYIVSFGDLVCKFLSISTMKLEAFRHLLALVLQKADTVFFAACLWLLE